MEDDGDARLMLAVVPLISSPRSTGSRKIWRFPAAGAGGGVPSAAKKTNKGYQLRTISKIVQRYSVERLTEGASEQAGDYCADTVEQTHRVERRLANFERVLDRDSVHDSAAGKDSEGKGSGFRGEHEHIGEL